MTPAKRLLSLLTLSAVLLVLTSAGGAIAAPLASPLQQSAGSAFTYQGQLSQTGSPVTGTCDFQFSLWDAANAGDQVGSTANQTLGVDGGLFIALLDFGDSAWNGGEQRWLEISVRCPAGSGSYTTLAPRQEIAPAPYAIWAAHVPWSGITSMPGGFSDGVDNDTTYTAGDGLTLTGTEFGVDTTYTQRRVSGTCSSGSAVVEVAEDGTVTCDTPTLDEIGDPATSADWDFGSYALHITGTVYLNGIKNPDITDVTASTGLSGGGSSGNVTLYADTAYLQRRVIGACSAGSGMSAVASDGTVTCSGHIPFVTYGALSANMTANASPFIGTLWETSTIKGWAQTWFVASTNNGSNYWTIALQYGTSSTQLSSFTTAAGSAGVWSQNTASLNTSLAATNRYLLVAITKTGSPGGLYLGSPVVWYEK